METGIHLCQGPSGAGQGAGERHPEPDASERRQVQDRSLRLCPWAGTVRAHRAVPGHADVPAREATLRLGQDVTEACEGTFVYMPPYLEHGIKAKTDVVMLLTMIKGKQG